MRIAIVRLDENINVRVDKIIYTLTEEGYNSYGEVYYISPEKRSTDVYSFAYRKVKYVKLPKINLPLIRLRVEPYYSWAKKYVSRILNTIRPDVVYSINLSSSIIIHELGYPLVFDDGEFYSLKEYVKYTEKGLFHDLILGRKIALFKKYEKILAQEHPVVTVSKGIVEYYGGIGARNVYIVLNVPSRIEYNIVLEKLVNEEKTIKRPSQAVLLCYIGSYEDLIGRIGHRNMYAFIKTLYSLYKRLIVDEKLKLIVKVFGTKQRIEWAPFVEPCGWKSHGELLLELLRCSFGLLIWPPNPYNRYLGTNKGYLYVATGNIPIITGDMYSYIESIKSFPKIIVDPLTYDKSIKKIIEELIFKTEVEVDKEKIVKYSMDQLVWEKFQNRILDAIRKA